MRVMFACARHRGRKWIGIRDMRCGDHRGSKEADEERNCELVRRDQWRCTESEMLDAG
jgi:hypothetical protein